MGKLAQATSKYTVYAKFEADGTVEKPDVIGAVFGQTEGLLGPDMELRELQKTGRIGRIDVEMKNIIGKTSGSIIIPSSLDSAETALIAATIETIERVGPCNAKIGVEKIEDVRITKRKYVVDRAKELLRSMFEEGVTDSQQIAESIKESVRVAEISDYKGSPAGPNLDMYDSIVIVEGRADVLTLLKNGIKNVVAIEGTSVPKQIAELSKQKITTAFLDGDRGGDLILKELMSVGEIDFVARAPRGKEVEELSKKEVYQYLRAKEPTEQARTEVKPDIRPEIRQDLRQELRQDIRQDLRQELKEPQEKATPTFQTGSVEFEKLTRFKEIIEDLVGTRAACFLDSRLEILGRVPVKEMFSAMRELDSEVIVLDGDIDQKLVNQCANNGIKYVIGMKVGKIRAPEGLFVMTMQELKN
ncbi:MAG: DNA primase DnaG [Candidatus Aenigmatarchaeota archaeon]